MSPEENIQNQERPAEAKPAVSPPSDNRGPQGQRRPRFRRDNRGERRDRGDRPRREEHPRPPEDPHRKHSSSIRKALDQVEHIRIEMKKVLDDLHEILETLEQVERDKTASEEEIEMLRESLRLLHRDQGHPQNFRTPPPPRRSAPVEPGPTPADSEAEPAPESDEAF